MDYIKASKILEPQSLINLKILLDGVKSKKLDVSFNMGDWSTKGDQLPVDPCDLKNECGTVCCLAGHGPLVGLTSLPNETWHDYTSRVFLKSYPAPSQNSMVDDVYASFVFLFNSPWADTEMNTLAHALFRLELFLEKGLPENFSWGIRTNRGPFSCCKDFTKEYKLGLHTL